MNSLIERTIREARGYVLAGEPIPLDVASKLMSLGVVVEDIERNPNG